MAHFWIDLANSPHVLFFHPIVHDLEQAGHRVSLTARDFAQTLGLCRTLGLSPTVIGSHGGARRLQKLRTLGMRSTALVRWARGRQIDVAVSHNAYAQSVAAAWLQLPRVTLMDYEYQPANHISFRLSSLVMVPQSFRVDALRWFGASAPRTFRYPGLKEEVYLDGFTPRPDYRQEIQTVFRDAGKNYHPDVHTLATLRPPATMAAYHGFENPLFPEVLRRLDRENVRVVLLPRTPEQRDTLTPTLAAGAVIPPKPLDGRELVAASDVLISAGGTMVREAAVLGVPAFSLYWGTLGGVDATLVEEGRLGLLRTSKDVSNLPLIPRSAPPQTVVSDLRATLIDRLVALAPGS